MEEGAGEGWKEGLLVEVLRHETEFMGTMFGLDAKNYHVWSYRYIPTPATPRADPGRG